MTQQEQALLDRARETAKVIPLCVTRTKKRELVRNMFDDHRAALKLAGWKWNSGIGEKND